MNECVKKTFTLTIVRHGQAFHNLPEYFNNLTDADFTVEGNLKILNTNLTDTGLMQANLVANRLKDTNFHLAITSDLKRTRQTAEAITKKNGYIDILHDWPIVRERCNGDFEGIPDLCNALWTIEESGTATEDYFDWSPPHGESRAELRIRVKQFLQDIQKKVFEIAADSPVILVVSHGRFMAELYKIISTSEYGQALPKQWARFQNTGVAQYFFTSIRDDKCVFALVKAECSIFSCASHLKDCDDNYVYCRGGCHGSIEKAVDKMRKNCQ
jgi:probable phosphoglycerate mutase